MKKVIVQVDIKPADVSEKWTGDESVSRYNIELTRHSTRAFQEYASEVGADYVLLHNAVYPEYHPQLEIFQLLEWDHYDLVCFADCDVIPNTRDDIFRHCLIDKLNYKHRCKAEIAHYGLKDFNSGVVVFGREVMPRMRPLVDLERADMLDQRDQTHMWHMMLADPTLGHKIPEKFNYYYQLGALGTNDGFIHFKGKRRHLNYKQFNIWRA